MEDEYQGSTNGGSGELIRSNTSLTNSGSRDKGSSSLVAAAQAKVLARFQKAVISPRDEQRAADRLISACSRLSFAEEAMFSFPRGKETIEGPSINLAKQAAAYWGNIESGLEVVTEDDEERTIRGFALDLETNTSFAYEDTFAKLIYRRGKGWIKPDERDLRELTNRRGAILVRNAILAVIPRDIVEEALMRAKKTIEKNAVDNLPEAIKKVAQAFGTIRVDVKMLETWANKKIDAITPEQIVELRGIYQSIKDGNSRWEEYVAPKETVAEVADSTPSSASIDVPIIDSGSDGGNRGHDATGLDTVGNTATTDQDASSSSDDATVDPNTDRVVTGQETAKNEASGRDRLHAMVLNRKSGDSKKADNWIRKASAAVLPHGEARSFETLTELEAATILASVESKEYVL